MAMTVGKSTIYSIISHSNIEQPPFLEGETIVSLIFSLSIYSFHLIPPFLAISRGFQTARNVSDIRSHVVQVVRVGSGAHGWQGRSIFHGGTQQDGNHLI